MFDCSTCIYEAYALAHVLPTTVMLLLEEVKSIPGYLTWNLEQVMGYHMGSTSTIPEMQLQNKSLTLKCDI
jgi:hypothetical protein